MNLFIISSILAKWTPNFRILMKILKNHTSCFHKDLKYCDILNNDNDDMLGMDLVSLKQSTPYISVSLANITKKSVESGIFSKSKWMPERRLSIRMIDINDENNDRPIFVVCHIVKRIKTLVRYQITDLLDFNGSNCLFEDMLNTNYSLNCVINDWLGNVNYGASLLDISKSPIWDDELEYISYTSVLMTFLNGIVWTSYVHVWIKINIMAWLLGANVDLKPLNLGNFTIPLDYNKIVLAWEANI